MDQGCLFTFHRDLHPADFAPASCEEGLRSIEGQTLDHPSCGQQGRGGTVRQDDRHYTAAVQQRLSVLIISCLYLEPFASQTLPVVVSIVTKKGLFDDAHKMQDISLALNVCLFVFSYICLSVLLMQ